LSIRPGYNGGWNGATTDDKKQKDSSWNRSYITQLSDLQRFLAPNDIDYHDNY
jgi:hypothetical protein